MVPYLQRLTSLAEQFEELSFHYLPRAKNQLADALATLASMVDLNNDTIVKPLIVEIKKEHVFCMATQLADGKPWFWDILNLIKKGEYPEGATKTDRKTLRQLAFGFILNGDILYKRS